MPRFVIKKKIKDFRPISEIESINIPVEEAKSENKKEKKEKDMITLEQVEAVENAVKNMEPEAKKVLKKDRGLIERTESSKIILTEDNRQVLND